MLSETNGPPSYPGTSSSGSTCVTTAISASFLSGVERRSSSPTEKSRSALLISAFLCPLVTGASHALEQANEALHDLKEDRVRGSAVLRVARA